MTSPPAFVFIGCIELREILGRRARDERELLEGLEQVPADSIYFHTHDVFLRDLPVTGAYSSDFANWVGSQIPDRVLAERLGVVDPFQFLSVEELREELVSIVDRHIDTLHPVPRVVFGEPFFFVRSHLVEVAPGHEARTLEEFRRALAVVDTSVIYFHAVDARLRRGVKGGDFARWIGHDLGLTALAEEVGALHPAPGGLERMRTETLRYIDTYLGATGDGR